MLLKLKASYDLVPLESTAQSMSENVSSVLKAILLQSEDFKAREAEVNAAVDALSPVLTRLFLYDRMNTGSQYLGTLLKYAGDQIIVSHISELGVAWADSLDEDYTGGYRALTVPKAADVQLVQFRAGLDDALSANGRGVVIAEARNGAMVRQLDQRVTVTADGELQTICFPAYLDLRAEITLPDGMSTQKLPLYLDGLQPMDGRTSRCAVFEREAANGNIVQSSVRVTQALTSAAEPGMEEINRADISLADGDTLLLCCSKTTSDYETAVQGSFNLTVRKGEENCPSKGRNDVGSSSKGIASGCSKLVRTVDERCRCRFRRNSSEGIRTRS